MRFLSMILSAVVFVVVGAARAADDDIKTVLDKAIKAHGGEEKLTKFKAGTMRGKGKVETSVGELEMVVEVSYMMPDKMKESAEFEITGNKIKTKTLINGDKITLEVNDKEMAVSDNIKAAIDSGRQHRALGSLLPLRDKKYKITAVGESKVLDKPALGFLVEAKGMKDVNLYFDKKSGLLVKMAARTINAENGQEVDEERIMSGYKNVEGMPMPTKILINRDGKKYLEMELEDIKLFEKLDDSEFKKQ